MATTIKYIVVCLCAVGTMCGQANNYTTVTSSSPINWNAASSWTGCGTTPGIPTNADTCTISAGTTKIQVTDAKTCGSITQNATGATITESKALTVYPEWGANPTYSIYRVDSGFGTHDVHADPQFIDPARTPCSYARSLGLRDIGTNLGCWPTTLPSPNGLLTITGTSGPTDVQCSTCTFQTWGIDNSDVLAIAIAGDSPPYCAAKVDSVQSETELTTSSTPSSCNILRATDRVWFIPPSLNRAKHIIAASGWTFTGDPSAVHTLVPVAQNGWSFRDIWSYAAGESTPQNPAVATAGQGGTYVGAFPPAAPVTPGNLFIRGTVQGAATSVGVTMTLTGPGAAVATQCPANAGLPATPYGAVTVNNGQATNTTVMSGGASTGAFCFATISNGTYTLTPTLAGHTFIAPSLTFEVRDVDAIVTNYFYPTVAGKGTFLLQTSATDVATNAGLVGVTMNLSGTAAATGTTTAPSGIYNFNNLPNGYYKVTPSMNNYVFAPTSGIALISNTDAGLSANWSRQFFGAQIGTNPVHTISGQILGGTSGPVTVKLSGTATATTTTDANGNYSFANEPAGPYTIRPSLPNYMFGPASLNITVVQYDSVANTFVATSTIAPPPQPPAPSGLNTFVNGGFEYGKLCNAFWPTPAGGNYGPFVSTDSHSGTYSGEIACRSMPGCDTAYVNTGNIPLIPGKNYQFTGWAKCPGHSYYLQAYYYVQRANPNVIGPKILGGPAAFGITCDGRWHRNTFTIDTSAATGPFNFGIINNTTCDACKADPSIRGTWLKFDDWTLTYSDGSGPVANVWRHPGRRNVYVTPQAIYVDGKPYLMLGTYGVPVKDYPAIAAMGMNTLATPSGNGEPTPECFNLDEGRIMDSAYDLGINILGDVTVNSRTGLDDGALQAIGTGGVATIGAYAHQFGPHLANIGWFVDEPDLTTYPWYLISPATFIQFGNAIRSGSPLPFAVDFQGAHWMGIAHMQPFNGSSTVWMTETYGPFTSINNALYNLNTVQERPIWYFQGSPNTGGDVGYYLAVQKSYYAIINGMTGILYFAWSGFHNTGGHCKGLGPNAGCTTFTTDTLFLNAIQQAVTELKSLSAPILQGTPAAVTATGGPAIMARQYNGQTFILAVTPVWGQYTARFNVPGLAAKSPVTVLFENRTITSSAGSFTDTFAGQVRHVYVIGTATSGIHTISGTISGAVTAGVTLNLKGQAVATTTSSAGGTYSFANLSDGSYTVTPSLAGYTFAPANIAVTVSGANKPAQNFTARRLSQLDDQRTDYRRRSSERHLGRIEWPRNGTDIHRRQEVSSQ